MGDAPSRHEPESFDRPARKGPRKGRTIVLTVVVLAALVTAGIAIARQWDSAPASPNAGPSVSPPHASSTPSTSGPKVPTLRITPNGNGDGTASDWAGAAPLSELPRLLASAAPGTQVLLRADAGPYVIRGPIVLNAGGAPGAAVVVRGVDGEEQPLPAQLVGDRVHPYQPGGNPGPEAFRLTTGANHLVFQDLDFRNIGNGCFRVAADVVDLTIRNTTATNVRRFLEDNASSADATATIAGLTVTDVQVSGYSRAFARIQYDSHGILFQDVSGDSEGQDLDPFAQGIQLSGTVHDAVFRRVSMNNSVDTSNEYWNGDGFSAEEETYDLRFEDTSASGNTDGGYDLKSRSATLVRVVAIDNKRNYRFWGNITVDGCLGGFPLRRGGSGTQAQVHATHTAVVSMARCSFTDADSRTIVFDVDGTARLTVVDSTVVHAVDGRLSTVEPTASLQMDRVQVE